MTDKRSDELLDTHLQGLYRKQAKEMPSAELDERIVSMAREYTSQPTVAQDAKANVSIWRRYRWPLSSAASVLLVVSLLVMNPNTPDEILTDAAMPVAVKAPLPQEDALVKPEVAQPALTSTMQANEQKPLSMSAPVSQEQQGPVAELAKMSRPSQSSSQTMDTQAKANISDVQALNHLQQLVDAQLWQEAEKLYRQLQQQRPRLDDEKHPQHQQWQTLVAKIKARG